MKLMVMRYNQFQWILFLFFCSYTVNYGLKKMLLCTSVNIMIDGASPECITIIENHLIQYKNTPSYSILHTLKNRFPFLAELFVTRMLGNKLFVDAVIPQPYAIINNEYAISDNGYLFACNYIDPQTVFNTRHCTIQTKTLLENTENLIALLKKIDKTLFEKASLTIQNRDTAILYPKMYFHYSVIFSPENGCTTPSFNTALLLLKKNFTLKKTSQQTPRYIADLRFEKQIVLYQESEMI